MTEFAKLSRAFVLVVLGALLLCAGVVYVVDPWRMFHPAWLGPDLYLKNQRIANAGLLRTGDMSIAIIGTSMMENIHQRDVEEIFGGRAMPLAISGSTAYEQGVVAQAATRQPLVTTLIWGLDWFSFMFPADQARQGRPFPVEMYTFAMEGRLKYLFGLDPLRDAVRFVRIWMGVPLPEEIGHDPFALHHRGYEPSDANVATVLGRAAQPGYHRDWQAIRSMMKCDEETLQANIVANLLPALRAIGSGQQVHLYFTPYSDVQMAFFQRYMPECFALMPKFRSLIVQQIATLEDRVFLSDAQAASVPTGDLRNYIDPLHHVGAVDRMILAAIKRGDLLVDRSAYPERISALQNGWVRMYAEKRHLFPATTD